MYVLYCVLFQIDALMTMTRQSPELLFQTLDSMENWWTFITPNEMCDTVHLMR